MLQGSNVLVQAKTGSGKTLAYAIPLVQQILLQQTSDSSESTRLSRLILLPSIELCEQVRVAVRSLLKYCDDTVKVVALKADTVDPGQIRENPDIVVATPAQLLRYCRASAAAGAGVRGKKTSAAGSSSNGAFLADLPQQLKHLVLDEADLILGQGYSEDLRELLNTSSFLGSNFQVSLFSATLDEQIQELKQLYMPPPCVTIKIKEPTGSHLGKAKLTQLYHLTNNHQDKFFMTLCLLQTHLIESTQKVLIFIATIPDAYKLKLFLEQFGIASAVLNHELPRNSRMSILDHFNRGLIDILIATDEATGEEKVKEEEEGSEEEEEAGTAATKGKKRTASGTLKSESSQAFEQPSFGPTVEVTVEDTPREKSEPKKKKAKTEAQPKKDRKKGKKQAEEEEDEEEDPEEIEDNGEDDEEDDVAMKMEDDDAAAPSSIDVALAEIDAAAKSSKRADRNARRKEAKKRGPGGFGGVNMSRGVDFKDVGTVLNFDFPLNPTSYTHRIGRTARANRSGVALSLVEPNERDLLEELLAIQLERRNGMGFEVAPGDLQPLPFDPAVLDGLRYRCNDKIRAVTAIAVREARLKEIKMELLNSERLKAHFEDNPRELALLRHDQVLRSKGIQKHLAALPTYLMPEYMQGQPQAAAAASSAPNDANRNKLRRNKHQAKIAGSNALAKKDLSGLKGFALKKAKGRHTMAMKNAGDPLRTFRAKPLNAAAASSGGGAAAGKGQVDF